MQKYTASKSKYLALLLLLSTLTACNSENNKNLGSINNPSHKDASQNQINSNPINTDQSNTSFHPKLSRRAKFRDADLIKISNQTKEKLSLKFIPITSRTLPVLLKLKGQIEPDFGKEVNVSSRILGRVVKIFAHPGDAVKANQVLAIVDSHVISEMEAELIEARDKLAVAKAQKERENQIYQEQYLRPKTLIEAKSRFAAAKAQLELAESEFKRQQNLYDEKISSQRNYTAAKIANDEAHNEYEASKLNLQREEHLYSNQALMKKDLHIAEAAGEQALRHLDILQQRLIFHGMSPENIANVLKTNQLSGSLQILAPVAGVITHANIAVGEMVHNTDTMFRIVDLSTVYVKADLPEKDLSLASQGSTVEVVVSSYPDRVFQGIISYIAEAVNQHTHTVPIKAKLNNEERLLKANMTAQIILKGPEKTILACPKDALFMYGENHCVLIDSPAGLAIRPIILGAEGQDYIEILSGLKQDDLVLTKGLKDILSLSP